MLLGTEIGAALTTLEMFDVPALAKEDRARYRHHRRTDPNEQESVVLLPELKYIHPA